jgi:hypothetical protein
MGLFFHRIPLMKTTTALLVCMLVAACASSEPKRASTAAAAPALRGDADQLAASALRTWAADHGSPQASAQIAKAAQLAPDRADLAWLHARLCAEIAGCQPEPIETRLRKLDPGNGAVWLGALSRAQAKRDTQAERQLLETIARAERFDLYWTTLVSRLTPALNAMSGAPATDKEPLTTSLNSMTGWLSSLAVAAIKPVTKACDKRRVAEADMARRCQQVAQAMQRADTTLVEALGLGIEQRLTPPGTASALMLEGRMNKLTYVSEASSSVIQAQVEREKFSTHMLELMRKVRREQDMSAAILRWANQPLDPPPLGR